MASLEGGLVRALNETAGSEARRWQTEEEAISEAEKLIEKKHYRVSSVITHDDTICPK